MVMKSPVLLLIAALLVGACGTPATVEPTTTAPVPPPDDLSPSQELEAARQRWAAAGLVDYHFVYEDDCGECDPTYGAPRTVTVWDGEVHDPALLAPSVDAAFDQIAAAIDAGLEVEAIYDPELGYPTDLWIDREARAYDGGTHWIFADVQSGLPGSAGEVSTMEEAWDLWNERRPEAYEFRATILCDCEAEARLWIQVSGDAVTSWRVEQSPQGSNGVSPITIDQMFADLAELVGAGGVLEEDGIRLSGSAQYHPTLGYPQWFGLDIEVVDSESIFGGLPPRLVFIVSDLTPITPAEIGSDSDLDEARARWEAVGPASYTYELTVHDVVSGEFSDGYVVEVVDGSIQEVAQNGIPIEYVEIPAATIDDLFDEIELAIEEGSEVDVLYHDQLAYPVLVTVTSSAGSMTVISIANLTPTG